LILEAISKGARKTRACQTINLSVRTLQRWEQDLSSGDKRNGPTKIPHKLSEDEEFKILSILNSKKYYDEPPGIVVAKLADEGTYIASESTMYRILKKYNLNSHRGKGKAWGTDQKRITYSLVANGSNQVWSWDITVFKTGVTRRYYYLYLIMDIYSRKIVGWNTNMRECTVIASDTLEQALFDEKLKGKKIHLHSDNGSPMKGAAMVETCRQNNVNLSYNRPNVSNDNPFSESLFKTIKYCPFKPARNFSSLENLNDWIRKFTKWYNEEHLHSGIGYVTPISRHQGMDKEILINRKSVYQQAKEMNPIRWRNNHREWAIEAESVIPHTIRRKIA